VAPAPGPRHDIGVSRLLDDVVSAARRIALALRPPPVSRVFVPGSDMGPDQHGSFCAVQLMDGSTGLAYAMLGDTRRRLGAADREGVTGVDALALAERLAGDDPAARSLALAAVNALSRHLLDRARFEPDFATSSLGSLELGPDDRLGMVGFFPPLVRRARDENIPLTVLELKTELVQEAPGLSVTLDPARLGACTRIVCTSTTLLNDSLEAVLAHARGCREFVLIGPSAGCIPDPLFARGVTAVGGAWVIDPGVLMERMGRGERWGDACRKFSVRAGGQWPGLEGLIERAITRS
jgi:uncharacterized protein (DUF4213/DUF364 family)